MICKTCARAYRLESAAKFTEDFVLGGVAVGERGHCPACWGKRMGQAWRANDDHHAMKYAAEQKRMDKYKRYRARRVARGLCERCPKRLRLYARYCDKCQQKRREQALVKARANGQGSIRGQFKPRDHAASMLEESRWLRVAKQRLRSVKQVLRRPSRLRDEGSAPPKTSQTS